MIYPWCKHCGSRNHSAFDCARKGETYAPTPEDLASLEPAAPPEPAKPAEPPPEPTFEPRPRFRGAPPTCTAENRLAFDSPEHIAAFRRRLESHAVTRRTWLCDRCGKWHYDAHAEVPSGASSGQNTRAEYPGWFDPARPFRRRVRPSAFQAEPELPKREAPKPAPKTTLAPAPRKRLNSRRDGELF
jgi:hypothetical protein